MAKKPSYIGALNAVANGERGGHELFRRWADATSDSKLKPVLEMVAIREMEHSWAFEKRLCELGFSVQARANNGLKKTLKLMSSKSSDKDKFHALGVGKKGNSDGPDRLLALLADRNIDPQTGALIGRFICEERDSGRVLGNAYRMMKKRSKK